MGIQNMKTERMRVILDQYNDNRTATEQYLNSVRDQRKNGFQIVNTRHTLPELEQVIWASRLLLNNSGVTLSENDVSDTEFKEALFSAFEDKHSIYDDAMMLLTLASPGNQLKASYSSLLAGPIITCEDVGTQVGI